MKELIYSGKYIPIDIVEQCFRQSQITFVDKTLCGNGFTTSFLNEVDEHGVKVLILPNVSTVQSKQEQNTDNRIQFFYGGQSTTIRQSTKIIVTTTDIFKEVLAEKLQYTNRVHKILLDEFHTVISASTYRDVLKRFLQFTRIHFSKASIVAVTATPILGQPIDIVIRPEKIEPTIIELNPNFEYVITEIKRRIYEGLPTVIFSNSTIVGKQISKINDKEIKVLEINLISGNKYLYTMTKNACISTTKINSYLVTSAGFEGHDLYENNAECFILQDLNNAHEHFTSKNIYQAINRLRKGASKITYARIEANKNYSNVDELIKGVLSKIHKGKLSEDKVLNTAVLRSKGYSAVECEIIANCFHSVIDEKGQTTVSTMPEMIAYYKEMEDWVNNGVNSKALIPFFKQRQIEIKMNTTTQKTVSNLHARKIERYAKANHEIIKKHELDKIPFKWNILNAKKYNRHIATEFLKQLENYLAYQRHDENFTEHSIITGVKRLLQTSNSGTYTTFNKLIKQLIKDYSAKKEVEYRNEKRVNDIRPAVDEYKKEVERKVIDLFGTFVNYNITFKEKTEIGQHRVYNQLTSNSIVTIQTVCELLGIRLQELDIKSCNPRIIYANCGLELPINFYGNNKENKRKINILLNSFTYAKYTENCIKDKKKPIEKKYHKRNKIEEFKKLGFDLVVIDWLFTNFYEDSKNALFTFCTFEEKKIIDKLHDILKEKGFKGYRRHDSIMLFNQINKDDFSTFTYKGVKGWFDEWNVLNDTPVYKTKYSEYTNGFESFTDEYDNQINTNDDDEFEYMDYSNTFEDILTD